MIRTYLTLGDIAEMLKQSGHLGDDVDPHNTLRSWRKRGKVPEPALLVGQKRPSPAWDPETISKWIGSLGQ